jgi:hypothetical protein
MMEGGRPEARPLSVLRSGRVPALRSHLMSVCVKKSIGIATEALKDATWVRKI